MSEEALEAGEAINGAGVIEPRRGMSSTLLRPGAPLSNTFGRYEDRGADRSDTDDDDDDGGDDDEECMPERHVYKFDPVTEYIIKVGRQNGRLDAAWDFFAHYTLPTYVRDEDSNSPQAFRLQEPGELGGRLYHLWRTPLKQLGDFGVGMGLYFQMSYVLGVVFFIAGLANTASIVYFRSEAYSGGQDKLDEQMHHRPCPLSLRTGITDFCTTIGLFIVVWVLGIIQSKWARSIDESEQTAGDYSIVVQDPDPNDIRPSTWRKFFERRFGKVTYVTVAIENGELIRLLHRRFEILEKIRVEARGQEEEDLAKNPTAVMTRTEGRWRAPWWKRLLIGLGLDTDIVILHDQLVKLSAEIEVLSRSPAPATKVFVTFESERSQRECLKSMTTGLLCSARNYNYGNNMSNLTRRGNVLSVSEAPEPGDIIWENLQFRICRWILEVIARLLFTAGLVLIAGVIVYALSAKHPIAAATFIAINNTVLPIIMTWTMHNPNGGEHHHTNSAYQASLMLKITLAQWMNTAFIVYVIQNIDTAPDERYIVQISQILWADAFIQPLFKVLDIPARFCQYFIAPFQKTQAKMNSYFLGTSVIVAELYASMLKTLFVCLFFSAIFPQGYFIAAVAMLMNYWSSKYCLFNRWKTPEPCDDSLTILTRRYLTIALVIHIVVSLQFYAGWPFDGLCPTADSVTSAFSDFGNITVIETEQHVLTDQFPQVGDEVYEKCDQDTPAIWTELPKEWMSHDQFLIVYIFCVFGIVMTCFVGVALFGETVFLAVRRLCHAAYKPDGKATSVRYSDVEQIQAYVPEIHDPNRAHSLLVTELNHLNEHHISWTGDYHAYNLYSADAFPGMSRKQRVALFSRTFYYRPSTSGASGSPTRNRTTDGRLVSDETTPLRPIN